MLIEILLLDDGEAKPLQRPRRYSLASLLGLGSGLVF
jgi:hypothetical protein